MARIHLPSPSTIGQDEVKTVAWAILEQRLKPWEGMELTTPLINHFSSRKMEYLSSVLVYARHLRQSDGWKN